MCLLIACTTFPSDEILDAGFESNPDGIGIGYKTAKGPLKYYKGLKMTELKNFSNLANTPMLIHFRKASIGEVVPELCHPFPITQKSDINNTRGYAEALFAHNGNVTDWRTLLIPALSRDKPLPEGEHWSDSKAIAFLVSVYGKGFLTLIAERQKFAVLDKTGISRWGDWHKISDTIHCSYNPIKTKYVYPSNNYIGGAGHGSTKISGAGTGSFSSSDDRVVAVSVPNPNANKLVIVTRGKKVQPEDISPRETKIVAAPDTTGTTDAEIIMSPVSASSNGDMGPVACRTLTIHDKTDAEVKRDLGGSI